MSRWAAVVGLLTLLGGGAPLAASAAPDAVVVRTARGETRILVRSDPRSGPVIPASPFLRALGVSPEFRGAWVEFRIGAEPFRFLLGVPVVMHGSEPVPISASAVMRGDTLFLPLQFAREILPSRLGSRFTWDDAAGRLVDTTPPPAPPPVVTRNAAAGGAPVNSNGALVRRHSVTIDPGHGGVDPGNPGIQFPRGVTEKHVTLAVGLLLREELQARGVRVRMTRTTDTLIDLRHRGGYCTEECDLFVSLHVNSLRRRPGYQRVRGFETYFLGEAKTEDAARVARMENDAVRFERPTGEESVRGIDFILKDLQMNEHLRESARFATLVQEHLGQVHPGEDRGVRAGNYIVLNTARRPAALIEMGFSTNPQDGRLLTTPSSQRALARSMADAIVAYLSEYERRTGAMGPTGSDGLSP